MNPEFTSALSKKQAIAVLIWLPVHCLLLPFLFSIAINMNLIGDLAANVLIYAIGAVYMLLVLRRFLRRDFDAFCDRPLRVLLLVFGAYWASVFGDSLIALLLQSLSVSGSNLNNDAVIDMAKANLSQTAAMAVLLAPIVEEALFRAGIFGLLRRKSRVLAYLSSALLFGLYHVWSGAIFDPIQLVFTLQYLPSSLALAWVYERTDSIWSSIFLHMLTNLISVLAFASL